MSADTLAAALGYAARGWLVFPVKGKVPVTEHGFKDASADPARVAALFPVNGSRPGVAIRTGARSGLVVLDVDTPKGGGGSLAELERANGKLPQTFHVLTGGGGAHYYFRHPGAEIRNSTAALGAGLDVRADGGYVVAPPSPHESGRPYKLLHDREPAELPAWLLALLTGEAGRPRAAAPVADVIAEGARNATLASLAGTMRHRGASEAEIRAALDVANRDRCQPPLPADEVARIAASIGRYPPAPAPTRPPAPEAAAAEAPAQPFTIEVRSTRDLYALPDPPGEDELLGPLVVRRQRTVLGGHTGEGKTTFGLAVARAVALGGHFLDWQGQAGKVLVLDAEQGLRTIKRRIREAGLEECDLVDYARVPDGLSLDKNVRHVAAVEELVEAGGYALVIADPLYKLHSGDSNDERAAIDLMRLLDAWRELYGFALVLPVHMRKPPPGVKLAPTIHDLFGSSAYVRGAEIVLGLQRVSNGYARLHFLKDRDGDLPVPDSWGLLFDQERGYRRDPDDGKERDLDADLAAFLAATPPSTVPEIARGVGAADSTVKAMLESDPARFRLVPPPPGRSPLAKTWTLSEVTRLSPETSRDEFGSGAPADYSSEATLPPKGVVPRRVDGKHSSDNPDEEGLDWR